MAQYTTQIRSWLKTLAGNPPTENVVQIVSQTKGKVFDSNWPIFDETYRPLLEQKILEHYYFREIGLETVGLFKVFLNRKMNEIMPYYNQMYESQLLKFNPFYDVDVNRTHNRKEDGTADTTETGHVTTANTSTESGTNSNTRSSNETRNEKLRHSDTPQSGLADVESGTYLTNADVNDESRNASVNDEGRDSRNVSDSGNTNNNNQMTRVVNSTEDYVEHVTGKQGVRSYSALLMEFRDSFLNIDMEVIEELSELFMGLY